MPGSTEWGTQVAEWEESHLHHKRAFGVHLGSSAVWPERRNWDVSGVKTGLKDSKRHHAPISLPSNSESENFDRKHGHYKRQENDNMPSEGPERWTRYVNRRPNSPNPSPENFDKNKGDHKRRDGVLSERVEHWLNIQAIESIRHLPPRLIISTENMAITRHKMPSGMPSGVAEHWPSHTHSRPSTLPTSTSDNANWRHGNFKRRNTFLYAFWNANILVKPR